MLARRVRAAVSLGVRCLAGGVPAVRPSASAEGERGPRMALFVVHGIGEQMSDGLATSSLAKCVGRMRSIVDDVVRTQFGSRQPLIVHRYVEWHSLLHQEYAAMDAIRAVTPTSFAGLRHSVNETIVDLLLFMAPAARERIVSAVASQLNTLYEQERAAAAADEPPRVAVFAHSLGAVIMHEVMCRDALTFTPTRLFTVGSPLGLFMAVQSSSPSLNLTPQDHLVGTPGGPGGSRRLLRDCDVCNVFHPYDPASFRLEPLLAAPGQPVSPPVVIPSALAAGSTSETLVASIGRVAGGWRKQLPDLSAAMVRAAAGVIPGTRNVQQQLGQLLASLIASEQAGASAAAALPAPGDAAASAAASGPSVDRPAAGAPLSANPLENALRFAMKRLDKDAVVEFLSYLQADQPLADLSGTAVSTPGTSASPALPSGATGEDADAPTSRAAGDAVDGTPFEASEDVRAVAAAVSSSVRAGRVDYMLPEMLGFNPLAHHTGYWSNRDLLQFVVHVCMQDAGVRVPAPRPPLPTLVYEPSV